MERARHSMVLCQLKCTSLILGRDNGRISAVRCKEFYSDWQAKLVLSSLIQSNDESHSFKMLALKYVAVLLSQTAVNASFCGGSLQGSKNGRIDRNMRACEWKLVDIANFAEFHSNVFNIWAEGTDHLVPEKKFRSTVAKALQQNYCVSGLTCKDDFDFKSCKRWLRFPAYNASVVITCMWRSGTRKALKSK